MQHLYAPWRDQYIKEKKPKGCVFCHIVNNPDEDEKNGVLFRGKNYFIVINRYPYTPGHFMVIPNQHIKSLLQLDMKVWMQISKAIKMSVEVLHECLSPKGINLGMNIGAQAGAGIEEHLHYHIVPRWERDTNFITTIGNTRVYSTDFDAIYQRLKKGFKDFHHSL